MFDLPGQTRDAPNEVGVHWGMMVSALQLPLLAGLGLGCGMSRATALLLPNSWHTSRACRRC